MIATFLGSSQPKFIAQGIEQSNSRVDIECRRALVDAKRYTLRVSGLRITHDGSLDSEPCRRAYDSLFRLGLPYSHLRTRASDWTIGHSPLRLAAAYLTEG